MSTEREILVAQKAAMFDLIQILKQQPDKTYTVEELEALIVAYTKGPANRRGLLSSKQLTRSTAERLSQLAGVDNRHFFGQDILLQLRQHVQRETAFFCQCLQALASLFP